MAINHLRLWGKTGIAIGGALLLIMSAIGFAVASSLPPGGSFTDDDGNIHEPAIEAIAAEGITKGCNPAEGNTKYCPHDPVTRAQMAAFLVRALKLPPTNEAPFTDAAGVFEDAINRLAASGITKGCNPAEGNTKFCPHDYVTRGQMAAFLVRALKLPPTTEAPFTDAAGVFEDAINRLAAAGITKGCNPAEGNTKFCPHDRVKRDQMASFLTRALGLTPIAPPPPTSSTTTTTTTGGPIPTTLPPVGPSASITICGIPTEAEEFSLREPCIAASIYNSTWAQASWPNKISLRWLDPDGQPVSACPVSGDCSGVDYHYVDGFPVGWTFYFYAYGENRDIGWHYLELWSGETGDEYQTLLLRDHFKLSDIEPSPEAVSRPTVSWECSNNPDGSRTCTGNTDTLDSAHETWTCAPVPDPDYPGIEPDWWDCEGDIDKRGAGIETWTCTSWWDCEGNVDTSDADLESWETTWLFNNSYSDGNVDRSTPGIEMWGCSDSGTGLSCAAEWGPWEWTCDGDFRGDWSCSGSVGRLAPVLGPVPADEGQ